MSLISPRSEHVRPKHLGQRWNIDWLFVAASMVAIATSTAVLAWSVATPAPTPSAVTVPPPVAAAVIVDTTTTSTTSTTSTPVPSVERWVTTSTNYCEHAQLTKAGTEARDGVVAVSPGNFPRLRGSTWRIISGPYVGKVVRVEDEGPSAMFDIWVSDCHAASVYGARTITVERVR